MQIAIPAPTVPRVQGPLIPNPAYNLLGSPLEIPQRNVQMIEEDLRRFELEKQNSSQRQREIDIGLGMTIEYRFPSNLNRPGAGYYQMAFDTLLDMLEGNKPLSYKRSTFITEWAFFEGELSYEEFTGAISRSVHLIRLAMEHGKFPKSELATNYAIFKFFTDTIRVNLPDYERRVLTHYPLRYDFEDFYGERDWTKGMVSKLLEHQTGQCHSLPLLYLILAEELGVRAYLANAPEHTYIKIPLANGTFQNVELTNGHLTTDAYVLGSGYIKAEALANGVYMRPLSKREVVAQCMIDLAKGYGNKYGFDDFYLDIVQTALIYQSNNVNGLYMAANYYYWLYQHVRGQAPSIANVPLDELPNEIQQIINSFRMYENKLLSLGYEEMPKEVYAEWLNSVEKEKQKSQLMVNSIQEAIWQQK